MGTLVKNELKTIALTINFPVRKKRVFSELSSYLLSKSDICLNDSSNFGQEIGYFRGNIRFLFTLWLIIFPFNKC